MSHTDAWYRFEEILPTATTATVTKITVIIRVFFSFVAIRFCVTIGLFELCHHMIF